MRTAISAGALALTLGGGLPVVASVPVSAATRTGDCEGGGLLGGLTGGLCRTVDTVGDIVGGVTGTPASGPGTGTGPGSGPGSGSVTESTTSDAKDRKDKKDEMDGKGGNNERRAGNGHDPSNGYGLSDAYGLSEAYGPGDAYDPGDDPDPSAQDTGPEAETPTTADPRGEDLLPEDFGGLCPPAAGSPGCSDSSAIDTPDETARPSASPRPGPPRRDRSATTGDDGTAPLPKEPLRPSQAHRHGTDDEDGTTLPDPPPVIDAEAPRIELLWPTGPVMRRLQRAVTPTRSPDPVGTALTAALLVAAILAVRLLYVRRIGEAEESIPLEPLRTRRHRTA
ncbi:hypothetical protein [Streptosporangium sp. NPDC051022]|uniref:hypothetical protein n=1 Tax=Streptosporangium sp. NPDC051022 TaxID=3155752 RepID=UPI003434EAF0